MRTLWVRSRLLWCVAAGSLLAGCAVDPEPSGSADEATDPVAGADGSGSGSGVPVDPVPTTSTAVASELSAIWQADRPGESGVVEFARFTFHADAIPTDMTALSWTPSIMVSLYVHKTNFATSSAERVEVIEPQSATLVSRNAGSLVIELADGTRLDISDTHFAFAGLSPARADKLNSLTYWPELWCGVTGTAYSLSKVGSYIVAGLPATVYDTFDVAAVSNPYGLEKKLVVGDASVTCLRTTATTSCNFLVSTTAMTAVGASDVSYLAQATGAGLDELLEALAGGTLANEPALPDLACDAGTCSFRWTRARPAISFP